MFMLFGAILLCIFLSYSSIFLKGLGFQILLIVIYSFLIINFNFLTPKNISGFINK
jgi:hypothetical protein